MNTTIRYWFDNSYKCRYMSFATYQQALNMIETFKLINVNAEVNVT